MVNIRYLFSGQVNQARILQYKYKLLVFSSMPHKYNKKGIRVLEI